MPRMNRRAKTFRTAIILAIVLVLGWFVIARMRDGGSAASDPRTAFAQCLTDKGVKMYGAFWCPHCAAQKKMFGKAFSKVSYVECAVPGNNAAQAQVCKDQNIAGYPTWIFGDGTRVSGEQTFDALAEKSGCAYGTEEPAETESQPQQ